MRVLGCPYCAWPKQANDAAKHCRDYYSDKDVCELEIKLVIAGKNDAKNSSHCMTIPSDRSKLCYQASSLLNEIANFQDWLVGVLRVIPGLFRCSNCLKGV